MQTTTPDPGQKPSPEQLMLLPASDEGGVAPTPRKPTAAGVSKAIRSRRYKQGPEAAQPMLLPPSIDDYVAADSPVRAIKAFVDTLNFETLGFKNSTGELKAGQPAFDPADLLELYLYGYLNRVRSSRRLEAECLRNLEVMWLLNGLRPGYHTIADFRKDNADALKAANSEFVRLCRELELFGGKLIGIDGSFFNGDASHASVKTKTQLKAELAATERDIERYQQELNDNDTREAGQPDDAVATVEKLAALEVRAKKKTEQIEQLEESGETQLSRTDPDARRLTKAGKKVTGYNVQTVIDDEHKLILAHEVTNAGNDFGQLEPMIELAEQALAGNEAGEQSPPDQCEREEPLEVVADAGYYTEADIAACEPKPVTVYVPIPDKHRAVAAQGRLPGSEFRYDADQDVYICPGQHTLVPEGKLTDKNGVLRQRYRSKKTQCDACPLRIECLPKKTPTRQIYRSEHADAADRHRLHMSDVGADGKMRQRAALCEHPFGTLKRWLGWDHFHVRGFDKVRGEMALLVNCYNLRRLLSIFGVAGFVALCEERRRRQAEADANGLVGLLRGLSRLSQALHRRFLRVVRLFLDPNRTAVATPSALAPAF